MTDKEKIDKFIKWCKDKKDNAESTAEGGASSWNWAIAETMEKVYKKAKKHFRESKKQNK